MTAIADNARGGRGLVGSVLRAMRLLDLFERGRPEMSLAEFVRRSGYTKSTTYRLLVTLEEAGWLERGPAGGFRLTIRPFQVGSILVDSLDLRREAGPIMARVAADVDETVFLVVPAGTFAVCLEGIPIAIASRYPADTHWSVLTGLPNSRATESSPTVTIVVSSMARIGPRTRTNDVFSSAASSRSCEPSASGARVATGMETSR